MITLARFRQLEATITNRGHGPSIEWTELLLPPNNAEEFAEHAIYVICNSAMTNATAVRIYERCMVALRSGYLASEVFKHRGKGRAIDAIWRDRETMFERYTAADDKIDHLQTLPFIGAVTAHHLAKNLGADLAKPDVHLERLARREQTTSQALCERLARETGLRAATVDTVLWRACALRVLNSRIYEEHGWDAAFKP